MLHILLFSFLFLSYLSADIQKNKIVQNAIVKKDKEKIFFDVSLLLNDQKAFKTAVDIFVDRYKKEKIDAFLSVNDLTLAIAHELEKQMNIPVYKLNTSPPFLKGEIKTKQKFIILTDILTDGIFQKSVIEWIESKNAFVMEVACITEDTQLKGRENVPSQVMSIFIIKPQKKTIK